MKPKKKAAPRPQITPRDVRECERFALYMVKIRACLAAGVSLDDAERAIYPDHYAERAR